VERDEGDDNWRSFAARPETIALEIEGQPFLVHFEATAIDSLGRKAR
jgi:hypothetical protein